MMKRALPAVLFLALAALAACGEDAIQAIRSQMAVEPDSLEFGEVGVGDTKELAFTVTNAKASALTVQVAVEGELFSATPTEFVLAPSGSQTVRVTFAPTTPSRTPYTGTVLLSSNATSGDKTAEVALSGTGIAAAVVVRNGDLKFADAVPDRPDTTADDRSDDELEALEFEVLNQGSDVVTITGAEFADDAGGVFASPDLAGLVGDYQPGEKRSASVTFDPIAHGEVAGSLVIATSSKAVPTRTVTMQGKGVGGVLEVCTRFDDDEGSVACSPSRPEDKVDGRILPPMLYGTFPDLEGRSARVTFTNEGNAPVHVTSFGLLPTPAIPGYDPETYDFRLWTDEAHTERLPEDFSATVCPADAATEACPAEVVVYVDYRARGGACCASGEPECVDLIADSCRELENVEFAMVTITSDDPIWRFVSFVMAGNSNAPTIVLGDQAARDIAFGESVFVQLLNEGGADLVVERVELGGVGAVCEPGVTPCTCANETVPSPVCDVIALAGVGQGGTLSFSVGPGAQDDIELAYLDPDVEPRIVMVHVFSNDPVEPITSAEIRINITE